jgi:transglutaminase-like putative cysteine protease
MDDYLATSPVIDWDHPAVMDRARLIRAGRTDAVRIARGCFEWVRDAVRHSTDYQLDSVTCVASDVLEQRTGYCYAKSHLLAALLRANGIPAAFCYQRLSMDDGRFVLHGLNAVHLPGYGWYRIDARGNRPGVDAQFTPPVERLAFTVDGPGEIDMAEPLAEPLPIVVERLRAYSSARALAHDLPDLPDPAGSLRDPALRT